MKTALDPTGKKITDKKIKIGIPFFCRPSFCQLLLTTLLLLRAGYGHVSYSSLESIIE